MVATAAMVTIALEVAKLGLAAAEAANVNDMAEAIEKLNDAASRVIDANHAWEDASQPDDDQG
jgi:hypothetical protein